jgi:MYXO-CTERM domain-containing protein
LPRTGEANAALTPKLLAAAVNDLGINRVRLELPSGVENSHDYWADVRNGQGDYDGYYKPHRYEKINDDADPATTNAAGFQWTMLDEHVETTVLPMKKLVEANGEQLYVTLMYIDFKTGMQGSLNHATNPAEYAELLKVSLDHLKTKYSLVPNAIELVLEPENTLDWSGANMGKGLAAAATRLKAASYNVDYIAPSVTNAGNAVPYLTDILAQSGTANLIKMLAYHRYVPGDYGAIWTKAKSLGMQTGMLEHDHGSVGELYEDLTVANASAWEKYALYTPDANSDYAYFVANLSVSPPTLSFTNLSAQMMPYFRYVRSGAVRVKTTNTSDAEAFKAVAFVNPNDTQVVVVKSDAGGSVKISGLPNGDYGVRVVNGSNQVSNGTDVKVSGGSVTLTLSGGVTAIYDKKTPGPNGGGGGGNVGGSGGSGNNGGSSSSGGKAGSSSSNGGSSDGGSSAEAGAQSSGGTSRGGTGSTGRAGSKSTGSGGTATSGNEGGETSAEGGLASGPDIAALSKSDDSGCGCRLVGDDDARGAGFVALASALALTVARRRRRA